MRDSTDEREMQAQVFSEGTWPADAEEEMLDRAHEIWESMSDQEHYMDMYEHGLESF